jgi:hypothetical protein
MDLRKHTTTRWSCEVRAIPVTTQPSSEISGLKAYTHSYDNHEVNVIKHVERFFLALKDATWGLQHRRTGKPADYAEILSPNHALHT